MTMGRKTKNSTVKIFSSEMVTMTVLFDQEFYLTANIRNNLKNVFMAMRDKILLRKKSVLETIMIK